MPFLDLDNPEHAAVDRRLHTEIALWLTTVTPDGQPQSTPIWFVWDGETILFYSQPGRPKLANIATNPKVSLHLVGDAEAEDVVTFEGVAALDPSAPASNVVPGFVERYRGLIARFGWSPAGMAADYSVAVRVRPRRVRVMS